MRSFGLIGYPLSHSFSKAYFTKKFDEEKVDAAYHNFPIASIEELPQMLLDNPALEGINVTIPYKEQVMAYLHKQSPVVQAVGACNCIRIRNGELEGFNTDVVGFEKSLLPLLKKTHLPAFVLGTGGASKAVQYVLGKLDIPFTVVSRKSNPSLGIVSYEELSSMQQASTLLWINTTPLGMYPKTDAFPPMDYSTLSDSHYLYDLVYNPAETRFLEFGRLKGATVANGHDMLLLQAEEGWRIWNERD